MIMDFGRSTHEEASADEVIEWSGATFCSGRAARWLWRPPFARSRRRCRWSA